MYKKESTRGFYWSKIDFPIVNQPTFTADGRPFTSRGHRNHGTCPTLRAYHCRLSGQPDLSARLSR